MFSLFASIANSAQSGNINGGFYFKIGPSFPIGKYKTVQQLTDSYTSPKEVLTFKPAKTGPALDMGFLVYIGPAFAKKMIRAGIDITFMSLNFNPVSHDSAMTGNKYQYWYIYAGQKIGPVISINPVDKLVLDLSYKLNAFVAFNTPSSRTIAAEPESDFKNKWGENLFQNEMSLSIRYSLVVVSLQYNFGKVMFNDLDSSHKNENLENNTVRILVGLKF
jgi:hypothetical protein